MDIDIELLDDIIAELCSMWTEALSTLDPLTNTPTQTSAGQISGPGAIHTGTYVSLKVGRILHAHAWDRYGYPLLLGGEGGINKL